MKTFAFLSFLLSLSIYTSLVDGEEDDDDAHHGCLSREEAHELQTFYVKFFENMADPSTLAFAQANLADDFQLFSDSTNNFLGNAYGSPTANGKQSFISGLEAAAVDGNHYDVLTSSHGCTTFHYVWRLTSVHPFFATGIDYVEVERKTHLIKKAYSEYNVKAIFLDNGFTECKIP